MSESHRKRNAEDEFLDPYGLIARQNRQRQAEDLEAQRRFNQPEENQNAPTSQTDWEKSFHATTQAGALKLNLKRFKDGSLEGSYKPQGMREEPLEGKILEDGDVHLSNDEGARWNGRFTNDGDQLLFGQIWFPGMSILQDWVKLEDVVMGSVPMPVEETPSQIESEDKVVHDAPITATSNNRVPLESTPMNSSLLKNPSAQQSLEQSETQELEPAQEHDAQLETWQRTNGARPKAKTWRETGKLKGNPPVRDEKNPPNLNIVEDEKTYNQLHASVTNLLKVQNTRAETMKNNQGEVTDFRYWFTKVYSFVTENELKFADENAYYYPTAVMLDVLYFDKIYQDNLEAASKDQETHWKAAFQTAKAQKNGAVPLEIGQIVLSLVSHMLAHIRFDLPRALAWTMQDYEKRFGAKPDDLKPDFFSMSGVFDNATRQMIPEMQTQLEKKGLLSMVDQQLLKIMLDGNMLDYAMSNLLGADMRLERLEAWERMETMRSQNVIGQNPYRLVNGQLQGDITDGNYETGLQRVGQSKDLNQSMKPSMDGLTVTKDEDLGELSTNAYNAIKGIGTLSQADRIEDNDVGRVLSSMSEKQLRAMPVEARAHILIELGLGRTPELNGIISQQPMEWTDVTSKGVLKLLEASKDKGDLVLLMDMVGAFDVLKQMQGEERADARLFLKKYYYPDTALNTIYSQILKWDDWINNEKQSRVEINELLKSRVNIEKAELRTRFKNDRGRSI